MRLTLFLFSFLFIPCAASDTWVYEVSSSDGYLGQEAGDLVFAEVDDDSIAFWFEYRSYGPDYHVDHWNNLTFQLSSGVVGIDRVETFQQQGLSAVRDVQSVRYDSAIAWQGPPQSKLVAEEHHNYGEDANGRYGSTQKNIAVAHDITVNGGIVAWTSSADRFLQWDDGLLTRYAAGDLDLVWQRTITPGDLDGDGTPDADDQDVDGDGVPNDQDSDSDNDGISDEQEGASGTNPHDPRDKPSDVDRDGTPDKVDGDVDGDGIPNENDEQPNSAAEPQQAAKYFGTNGGDDLDGDGIPNRWDDDLDGDGIPNEDDGDPTEAAPRAREEAPAPGMLVGLLIAALAMRKKSA